MSVPNFDSLDMEEGEIQSDSENEGEGLQATSFQKLENEKILLSNQERIDRLYCSILSQDHDKSIEQG